MQVTTLFLIISVLAGACGQLMMKAGLLVLGTPAEIFEILNVPLTMTTLSGLAWLIAGIFGYFVAVLLWIKVLKVYPLSLAYPLLSLGYIVVYLGSAWWPAVSEPLSLEKSIGVCLIIIGVLIVTHFRQEKAENE